MVLENFLELREKGRFQVYRVFKADIELFLYLRLQCIFAAFMEFLYS